VIGIEMQAASSIYRWERADTAGLDHVILNQKGKGIGLIGTAWRLVMFCLKRRPDCVFLCHYNLPGIFLAATLLRLIGFRVITMLDSKFDDYPRSIAREWFKGLILSPYQGAMVASRRSADYVRFLGFKRRPVVLGYDSLDIARLRTATEAAVAVPHAEREFLIVARLVDKKNLVFALRAYASWQKAAANPRKLRLIGYGDQEQALRDLTVELGLAEDVVFEGEAEAVRVAQAMRQSLCLLLPSTEEQFGLVVIEALAQGLPVLVSQNAGAVDELVDNGVNGWIVDPYRPAALVAAMALFDRDAAAWQSASVAALGSAERGDVRHFVLAAKQLAQPE
jgi:glycosyltransferase involved in cell wall biosynthesis